MVSSFRKNYNLRIYLKMAIFRTFDVKEIILEISL